MSYPAVSREITVIFIYIHKPSKSLKKVAEKGNCSFNIALLNSVGDKCLNGMINQEVLSLIECQPSLKISGDSTVKLLNLARVGINKRRISG
ncbi:hypothetical protein ABXS71_08425 [Bacillus infantis]|uniref:hypothetical protein n=1 Tax=Bacillus infantis TaxID=324767 RepID=UPI00344D642B